MSVLNRMYAAMVVAQEVIKDLRDADGAHGDVTPINTAGNMLDAALEAANEALKIKTVVVGIVCGDSQKFAFCDSWQEANRFIKDQLEGEFFSFRRTYNGEIYTKRLDGVSQEQGQLLVDTGYFVSEMLVKQRVRDIGGHPLYPLFLCTTNKPEMVEIIECQEALAICKEVDKSPERFFTNGVSVRYFAQETAVAIKKIGELP